MVGLRAEAGQRFVGSITVNQWVVAATDGALAGASRSPRGWVNLVGFHMRGRTLLSTRVAARYP